MRNVDKFLFILVLTLSLLQSVAVGIFFFFYSDYWLLLRLRTKIANLCFINYFSSSSKVYSWKINNIDMNQVVNVTVLDYAFGAEKYRSRRTGEACGLGYSWRSFVTVRWYLLTGFSTSICIYVVLVMKRKNRKISASRGLYDLSRREYSDATRKDSRRKDVEDFIDLVSILKSNSTTYVSN